MTAPHRVLLVDDDDEVRGLLARALELDPRFSIVGQADNGLMGVACAQALQPDVILLDLAMPVLDGLEALPHLRTVSPESFVVVMSGFQRAPLWPSAARSGALGYLEKGLPVNEIAAHVATTIQMLGVVKVLLGRPTGGRASPGSAEVTTARRFVDGVLREHRVTDQPGDITLMVSELVTNAILHAHAVPHVIVQVDAHHVRIDVQDPSPTRPMPRAPDPSIPGGRGLHIVQSLADAWGVDIRPTGKSVWFTVRRNLERTDGVTPA